MILQTRSILSAKNYLKETIKGILLEKFIKLLHGFLKRNQKIDFILNAEDDKIKVEILHRIFTEKSNCIDIGCNKGNFLILIKKLSPLGYHYAFEPIPRLADRLKKRFPKVNVMEAALSSLNKDVWNRYIPDALTESIALKTKIFDDILPANLKLGFIKVDVEGVEYSVFKGGEQTIKNQRSYIIVEHGSNLTTKLRAHRIYDFLVDDCDLQIFELKSWLNRSAPLTINQFIDASAWNFLAAP